jgi:hypothetical protein
MVRIRVETSPATKVSPRRTGLSRQENLENRRQEEKQKTTSILPMIGASSAYIVCTAAADAYCQSYLNSRVG